MNQSTRTECSYNSEKEVNTPLIITGITTHWDCCVTVLTYTCTNVCSTTYPNSAIFRQHKVGFHLLRQTLMSLELTDKRKHGTLDHCLWLNWYRNQYFKRDYFKKWRVLSLCCYVLSVFFCLVFNVCFKCIIFQWIPLLIGDLLNKQTISLENRGTATNTRKSSQTIGMVQRRRLDGRLRQHADDIT